MAATVELKLTGIAHGGEALGTRGSRTIFVGYALPGETVRVRLVEEHQRWARAELVEVVESAVDRVEPVCPHFGPGRCGGCQWQHIGQAAQLDFKRRIVRDQLQRLAGIAKPLVQPARRAGEDWAYRTQEVFYPSGEDSLGLPGADGRSIHAVDACPILHPVLSELYADFNTEWDGLRSVELCAGLSSDQRMVSLRTVDDEVPEIEVDIPVSIVLEKARGAILPLIGDPWVFETIAGHDYRLSAGTRRPISPQAAETLIEITADYLQLGPGLTVMDVYCGQGLFTQGFAGRASLIIGIDEDAVAIEDCAFNCSHLDNVSLHEGPPSKVLRKLNDPIDLAVVSSPAAGMGHRVAQNLARLGARRLVYVAQNPATLARDVEQLAQAGYRFVEATPVDVAPQTYYVTAVALFVR
ncbi:MAG: class I SAM-dependent RNA methyltransferase [Caldilineales bacterium]|nr:class I SAM-dependent RNA methyltransferase [Caldilineales bacterium]